MGGYCIPLELADGVREFAVRLAYINNEWTYNATIDVAQWKGETMDVLTLAKACAKHQAELLYLMAEGTPPTLGTLQTWMRVITEAFSDDDEA